MRASIPERLSTQLRQSPTRYVPRSRIAAGGMAEVWKADAIFPDGGVHEVAIKRVLPGNRDALFLKMFEDEARLGMLLRHPNIVRVYDARDIGTTSIMVMELVEGDTLKGLLDRAQARGAPMPVPAALFVARGLAVALAYTHSAKDSHGRALGVVHRDVSPHNLLLGRDGAVKLTDFGLADASVNETARGGDLVGGKLGYLAPEVIERGVVDHRIDIFALGIVLWEMLAGRRLFQVPDDAETVRRVVRCDVPALSSINGAVSAELEALVRELLARDPAERAPSAADTAKKLGQMLGEIGSGVSERDVALLIGVHLARKAAEQKTTSEMPLALGAAFAEEMNEFARVSAGDLIDLGAAPLDPGEFSFEE
jgi:eukaryotic-like serine/threonine-protein kinase